MRQLLTTSASLQVGRNPHTHGLFVGWADIGEFDRDDDRRHTHTPKTNIFQITKQCDWALPAQLRPIFPGILFAPWQ